MVAMDKGKITCSFPTKCGGVRRTTRLFRRSPLSLGKVAAVLDNSYSTSGTQEKKRRPLGVAWAVDRVLAAASREYRAFWTHPFAGAKPEARGATDLSTPILDARETSPELLVIVSDGVENDPPGGAGAVLKFWQSQLDPKGRGVGVIFVGRFLYTIVRSPGKPEDAPAIVNESVLYSALGNSVYPLHPNLRALAFSCCGATSSVLISGLPLWCEIFYPLL
jgi:hypothetical protein